MTVEVRIPASPTPPETGEFEIVERRSPFGVDRHPNAWRYIALYEGGQQRRTMSDWSRRQLGEAHAWENALGVRLGDLAPGTIYRIEREWCRRIQPPVLDCYGRALGRPGTKPDEQALVPADPWRIVATDKALAYLKAVPHGARFRLMRHDPWYMKSESDFLTRTIIARREEDGTPVAFPPNLVVELDPSEIPEA